MVLKEVEKGEAEIGAYWRPEEVGDAVEGNIYEFAEDTYNNRKQIRINLYMGVDENNEPRMTLLPAHADLKRTYVSLEVGDYIRVEVVEKKEPRNNNQYPQFIYRVLKDEERKVSWD